MIPTMLANPENRGIFGAEEEFGWSDVAVLLRDLKQQARKTFFTAISYGDDHYRLLADLDEAYRECSVENWDGYGAEPVLPRTLHNAAKFLEVIPSTVEPPEIGTDPDGEISFEWGSKVGYVFSVSIGPENKLNYAGLRGSSTVHGTEYFNGKIPPAIFLHLGDFSE